MELFMLYVATRLDTVIGFAYFGICVSLFIGVMVIIGIAQLSEKLEKDPENENLLNSNKNHMKLLKRKAIPLFLISTTVVLVCPSKDDAMLIYGGYLGLKVVEDLSNNTRIDETSSKAIDALNRLLDDIGSDQTIEEISE